MSLLASIVYLRVFLNFIHFLSCFERAMPLPSGRIVNCEISLIVQSCEGKRSITQLNYRIYISTQYSD